MLSQTAQRDLDRWNQMVDKTKVEEEYYQQLRDDGSKARKNRSTVAYDILTLQYNQDEVGIQQKYDDDMVRYRAAMRSNALVIKGDSRVAYNIISGDSRSPLKHPDPVVKPGYTLRQQQSQQQYPYEHK